MALRIWFENGQLVLFGCKGLKNICVECSLC